MRAAMSPVRSSAYKKRHGAIKSQIHPEPQAPLQIPPHSDDIPGKRAFLRANIKNCRPQASRQESAASQQKNDGRHTESVTKIVKKLTFPVCGQPGFPHRPHLPPLYIRTYFPRRIVFPRPHSPTRTNRYKNKKASTIIRLSKPFHQSG